MDHFDITKKLAEAQEAESDNRERVREADHFLNKRDGMWEPRIITKFAGKPRYTFDECNPIVDDILGEMEQTDFSIRVLHSGGQATKQLAMLYEGIIRNIENISQAKFVYNAAARFMVGTGIDGWRVVHEYRDDDSFQQDLLIKKIPNFVDSVWFDPNATCQDMSDASDCWVLTSMSREAYDKKYPKGSGLSVGIDLKTQVYQYKKTHEVVVGEYLWKKKFERELALLSDGTILEVNDDFRMMQDEMQAAGVTVERTRKRPYYKVYSQMFDGLDFLGDAKETVFCYLPIIPCFGNFKISESKVIYWGIVEKLMDAQRVINYAESRKIEEGALSPRGKYWMTKDQAKSPDVRKTLRTLNTNTDPVQFYDWADGQGVPTFQGSPQSNPGLVETAQSAQRYVQRTSGTYDEARGNAPSQRSGAAVQLLQLKSDNPKRKWFTAMEIAICHTCRILVKAIPKVYDTKQQMRIMGEDGTIDTAVIQNVVVDSQTGQTVILNDLSKGEYSVTCSAGPAFHSRQQETVNAINEIATIDPSIMQLGSDILLNNIAAPGIDKIAERKRLMMLQQGLIPPTQQTQQEKLFVKQQQLRQQQQANQLSPLDKANLTIAEAQAKETQGKNQERAIKLQLEQQKLDLKSVELSMKQQIESAKLQQKNQQQVIDSLKALAEQIKSQAEALKTIREAIGADAMITPEGLRAFNLQSRELADSVAKQ